jgi:hypothetical protein
MQRCILSQEDQKTVNRWRLVVVSVYSSIAVVVLLLALSPTGRDHETIQAQNNSTVAHVVKVVR